MSDRPWPVTIVNHISVDMPASRDAVWRRLCGDYLAGESFKAGGYEVTRLDAPVGGLGQRPGALRRNGDGSACWSTMTIADSHRLAHSAPPNPCGPFGGNHQEKPHEP